MKNSLLPLAIIALSATLGAQTVVLDTFNHDGLTRNYRVFLPSGYTPVLSLPLVLNLHGYGSNAAQQQIYSQFDAVADTGQFIVVYPNGVNNAWNVLGGAVDDVGFIDTLITVLHNDYNIDLDRVYSTGLSNGGFMTYLLACQLPERFAAVAAVAGTSTPANQAACNPSESMPVLHIHGTADAVVSYNGAPGYVSVNTLLTFWAAHNGCDATPGVTPIANTATNDGSTADIVEYADCDPGVRTVHIRVNGGGHTWPGSPINIGVTNQDFHASVEIWRFFRQYARGAVVSADEPVSDGVKVWPNPAADLLNIELVEPGAAFIRIFDVAGQAVYASPVTEGRTAVKVSEMPAGMYWLQWDVRGGRRGLAKFAVMR